MQQFKALLKKEFISFFRSYLAYFIIFIYLSCSIGSAFYISSLLASHDAGLYSLFFCQPFLLIIIIPAITMKMWAEEYKQGTAEFLLTQPISFSCLVIAKFFSSWIFCLFLSLLLLPFVFYISTWINLDIGNIVSAYLGLWLFIGVICAFGCFISALCKNVILAYITGVSLAAVLLLIPYNFVNESYNNLIFAEAGLNDITIPILLTIVFLILNKIVLDYGKTCIAHKNLRFGAFSILLIGASIILIVGMQNFFFYKFDLTIAESYTPKAETLKIISEVDKPLTINLYASKDFINSTTDNYHHFQQISRFLKKYETLSQGMIRVSTNIVEAFSEMEEQALDNGLYFELNSKGSRNYFGATIASADRASVIKQFLRPRQMFAESDIDKALLKVIHPEKIKTVGVYMDPRQNLKEFEGFLLALEDDYNVELITSTTYQIRSNTDLLLMINPKKLESTLLYAVDQYLMRGGKIVIFYDFYTENQNRLINMEKIDVLRFLNKWEISLAETMVDDGLYNNQFGKILHNVKLNKAIYFTANKNLNFTPFISDNEKMIGAIISGEFKSLYNENPYFNTSIGSNMYPFVNKSSDKAQIAFIGDVDMLLDRNWISPSSPDRNPYSIITTSGNGSAAVNLINNMLENEDYSNLPINKTLLNDKSIGEKIKALIFSRYEAEFVALKNKIDKDKTTLFIATGNNYDVMNEIEYVTASGRTIKKNEKKLKQLEYSMLSEYKAKIHKMAFGLALLWPLLAILLCFTLFSIKNKIHQSKISEIINE